MQVSSVVLSLCLVAVTYGLPSSRIVGGEDARPGKFPFMVSIKVEGGHYCAGSIINRRYILTAAHCLVGLTPKDVTIHAGSYEITEPGSVYEAEKFISHQEYEPVTSQNDIALIRLNKDVLFEYKVIYPVTLTNSGEVYQAGDNVTLAGWGMIRENGPYPFRLQEINLKISTFSICKSAHPHVTQRHICTLTKANEGSCIGDSGGPLIDKKGLQIGIVSYGYPCAIGFADVYTNVMSYKNWIVQQFE